MVVGRLVVNLADIIVRKLRKKKVRARDVYASRAPLVVVLSSIRVTYNLKLKKNLPGLATRQSLGAMVSGSENTLIGLQIERKKSYGPNVGKLSFGPCACRRD